MLLVDKVYVTHYSPLKERKTRLFPLINQLHHNVKWVEDEPSSEDREKYLLCNEQTWNDKKNTLYKSSEHSFRHIKNSEFSLAFKHIKIYEDIVKNNYDITLILEDDVLLEDDFVKKFNFQISNTPIDWDFIFIGSGCDLHIDKSELIPEKVAYLKDHPSSKCTDSYCVTLDAAKIILKTIIPSTFPIDYELNYQMFYHNLNTYWWEPCLTKQGSQKGYYKSEIQ